MKKQETTDNTETTLFEGVLNVARKVDNLINAGYGLDTLFGGQPATSLGSRIGQMDEKTIKNLGKIVEDLKKLKLGA